MSVVYLHNFTFQSRAQAMAEFGARGDRLTEQAFWNIWRVRSAGWNLEEGDRVLLVAAWMEHGVTQHCVTQEVVATDVRHWDGVKDWNKTTSELGKWTGWGTKEVRENEYTKGKRDLSGPLYVLAWRPAQKTWIDIPLPAGVRIGRNGWTVLDSAEVDAWPRVRPGLERRAKAAARQKAMRSELALSIAEQVAVRSRAREVSLKWLANEGWSVHGRTTRRGGWEGWVEDRSGKPWSVIISGTRTNEVTFKVSGENADQYALHRPVLLLAVHSIKVELDQAGRPKATGGKVAPLTRWTPSIP